MDRFAKSNSKIILIGILIGSVRRNYDTTCYRRQTTSEKPRKHIRIATSQERELRINTRTKRKFTQTATPRTLK